MNPLNQSRIFISYSHRGRGPEWKAKLLRALHVFEQQHLLDVWQDGKIRVSAFWDDDIKQAMSSARIAVVLLTREALEARPAPDANYILDTEFPFLRELQRQGSLTDFPVVCENCDWRAHDWLRATQAPNESNPLAQLTAAAQDSAFRKLATAIAEESSRIALAGDSALRAPQSELKTYLDKFPLTRGPGLREEKLIGREQELALLDLAFAQPHTAIVSLVAWGGVGKTMLVQHWLQRLQREGWFGARRVYAWSFYSQGTKEDRQASEDTFLAHALEWFGVQCEPTLSPWDKGRLLADAVARERTLLILDGIEPLQYPPGPMGGQLRAPGVQSLLKQLARKANALNAQPSTINQSLCLVTTREPLTDLADFQRREGSPWGSVLRVDLGNLTDEAGAALLNHAGANRAGATEIKPDDKELLAASREVDGHALTLNLLGRFLARAHGGDIRRRDLVKFEEADRKEQGGTTFKMLAAFENWFAKSGEFGARQLAVLRMLGLFDRPADAGCIGALRKLPVIVGLTDPLFTTRPEANTCQATVQPLAEEDFNTATSFLTDFGLLVVQADADNRERLLDCHPLIREHFAKQVRQENNDSWRAGHNKLCSHLLASCQGKRLRTLFDVEPLYQAVSHGCHSGRAQFVCDNVLRDNLLVKSRTFESFDSDLIAIRSFFPKGWNEPMPEISQPAAAWLLGEAGYCLRELGRLDESAELTRCSLEKVMSQENWKEAAATAGNLSEMESFLGCLNDALQDAKLAVLYADRSNDWWQRVRSRVTQAHMLHAGGAFEDSLLMFEESEKLQIANQPGIPLLPSISGYYFCERLLRDLASVSWKIQLGSSDVSLHAAVSGGLVGGLSIDQVVETNNEVQRRSKLCKRIAVQNGMLPFELAICDLLTGQTALCFSIFARLMFSNSFARLDTAASDLKSCVQGFRKAKSLHWLPAGLLHESRIRVLDGDADGARADLDEAWDIAERGPMRLHLADIHLYRARLFFREKPYPWQSPQDDLAAAEKLINACGYHRRDQELADAKRAIIGNT